MARIAFAWELGGELGHATASAALAGAMSLHGHRIALVFRELRSLAYVRGTEGYDVYQAPHLRDEGRGSSAPCTYSDILLGCGWRDGATLAALVGAWRAVLRRCAPDLVVEDYAPTAHLAAVSLGIPTVRFGNGFQVPPRLAPMPAFRFDHAVPPEHVLASEARALASANAAMERFGMKAEERLCDRLACDEEFLCTFPELDHYGERQKAGFWGPRFQSAAGQRVDWPAGRGKRVFVYVKKGLPQMDALIEALVRGGHRVVAFVPQLEAERSARLAGPGRVVSTQPLRLDTLLRECDLVVSHGGEMAAGSLSRGVPQLVFPSHYEQYLTARRIEQVGGGVWLPLQADARQVSEALERVLAEPRFAATARAFAAKYPAFSPGEQRRRMAARLEQVLAARILSPTSTR